MQMALVAASSGEWLAELLQLQNGGLVSLLSFSSCLFFLALSP